jgi:hypothetical protein
MPYNQGVPKTIEAMARPFVPEWAEKQCTRCEEMKPVSEFWRERRSPDGLQAWCRQCQTAYALSKNFPASDTGTIVCVQCHVEKSVLQFYTNRRLKSGRVRLCRACMKSRRLYRSSPQ